MPGGGAPPAALPAGDLGLIGPDHVIVTSEPKIHVSYGLKADKDPVLQNGVAVISIDHDSSRLPEDRSLEPGDWVPMPLDPANPRNYCIPCRFLLSRSGSHHGRSCAAARRLCAKALFRGRVLEKTTDIVFATTPDLRIVRVPSSSSGIVVTSGFEAIEGSPDGSIAIVLDASGSMAGQGDQPGKSKYLEAVEALKRVLSRLPDAPASLFGSSGRPWEAG